MSHLTVLADALLFLGKSIDPQSVTKVLFGIEHSPSDIGLDVWKFKATLQGSKGDEDPGGAQLSFSQSWEGVGHTDEEAIRATFKPVQDHIEGFLRLRENETGFAQQALLVLTSGVPQNIWATDDPAAPPVETVDDEAAMREMAEAAGPLNGQTSSV